ncbi:MAG TPA: PIN domain-containing protein [Hanamia sp.]|nr:PIN domain-containing protein [Hanamia sp.]
MGYKVFLDTNIVLDIFHRDRPFYPEAVELFKHLDENKFSAFYSESVLTTIAYVLSKRMKPNEINLAIFNLNKKINLLPCSSYLPNKCLEKNPPDFGDALLYEIALQHELDYFITSNKKDFKNIQNSMLPVINAKAFNKLLASD